MDVNTTKLLKHHDAAWRWALTCCANRPEEAIEVLQTTYLKVLEGRARYDGCSSYQTWLFGVVRLTARELWRRNLGVRLGLLNLEGEPPPLPSAPPDRAIEESEQARAVREALATLPARQRHVVELVFVHDLSLREAAQVLGIAMGSAARHYDRAKKALAAALAAEWRAP